MRSAYFLLVGVALAGLLPAQRRGVVSSQAGPRRPEAAVATRAPVKPEDLCTVEGAVVNAKTGEPLKKAQVLLIKEGADGPPTGVTTDAGGRFRVIGVEPGRYRLTGFRNGFVRPFGMQRQQGQQPSLLNLAPGQQLKDITLRLLPGGVIAGRVVDEDGEAMVNARVQALVYRYSQSGRQLMPAGFATTDDLGQYRLHGLSPGRFYVGVAPMDGLGIFSLPQGRSSSQPGEDRQEEGYATLYYPGVLDPAQAALVTVQAGEEKPGVDFRVTPTRTVRVRGRVVHGLGEGGGRQITVSLVQRGSGSLAMLSRRSAVLQRDGSFEIRGVVPGSYSITAAHFREGQVMTARQPVEVGNAPVDGVELILKPGQEVRGRVRVEGDAPLPAGAESIRVSLRAGDGPMLMMGGAGAATVTADGTFTLKNIGEGEYHVALFRLPEGFYLKTARFGSEDVLGKALTAGLAGGVLDLVLSPAAASVEGVVLDEKKNPFSGATVVLVPEGEQRNNSELYQTATSDQQGRFALRGIAPGEYKLFAWDGVEDGAWLDPEFLKGFESKGEAVSAKERARHTLELTALPAEPPGA